MKKTDLFFRLVQISTIAVFLGRAWQHWFWEAPFRVLFWDENWMRGIVETLSSYSWDTYITSTQVDNTIQGLIRGMGLFYLLCGILALLIRRIPRSLGSIIGLGALSLAFLAALYCKERFFSMGQFLEYTLQFATPLFLLVLQFHPHRKDRLIFWMKLAIAFTFVCHGLYAVGYYPRPGEFVQMTIDILGISERGAVQLLNLAGLMDFLVAIVIFLPLPKWVQGALLYAFFWGTATSLARVWANFYLEFPLESLHQWLYEAVFRLPHALIPLAVWVALKGQSAKISAILTNS